MSEKFCVKCGKKFVATGREVICPSCREAAKAEAKKAAVLKAKKASWAGESVPVRISGRASTIVRRYGAEKGLPFAQALDELLKSTDFFQSAGKAWEDITPYKSHRRDKTSTTETAQEVKQVTQDVPQVQAAKKAVKTVKAAKKAVKTVKTAKKAVKAVDSTALAELYLSGVEAE